MCAICVFSAPVFAADTNTVSSTVVTDKAPPTANAPSIVVNNSDVCKSAFSAGVQTQILGIASGVTVTDENCERIKLARSLYGMGMKAAAVSTLCRDHRVFDAMWMSGTPCPFMGKIGNEAKAAWESNLNIMPDESEIRVREQDRQDELALAKADKQKKADIIKAKQERDAKRKVKEEKRANDEGKKHMWFKPIGAILMLLLI